MSDKQKNREPADPSRIVAALDIGTTKVACLIGVVHQERVDVVGVGIAQHKGVRQGVVVNIEATSDAIQKAREEAELMSGLRADSVWLGIGGTHVESFDSTGMVAIKNEEVNQEDIDRVIEAAKAVAIPTHRELLHVLPKSFKIDDQDGIPDPVGMSGVRLEASVHIITASHSAVQNLRKCVEKSGFQVEGIVLQQLASGLSILSEDEKNLGACVVDVGGGTCDLILYSQGSVIETEVIPVGGINFTHDVAMGLRTTQKNAEELKKQYGSALPDAIQDDETIDVEGVGGRQSRTILRKELSEILAARAEETLELIRKAIDERGLLQTLGSGVVVTGGSSHLHGMVELGDYIFDVPVRRGVPTQVGGLIDVVKGANYSTSVGLLIYGKTEAKKKKSFDEASREEKTQGVFANWTKRFKEILGAE